VSLQILQQLFNVSPWKDVEHLIDNRGEKIWFYWREGNSKVIKLKARYRSHPAGSVTLVKEDEIHLTLADISVPPKYRKRGIGKGLLQETIRWAMENSFLEIWGVIKSHNGSTPEYLREWYAHQGFEVTQVKPESYQIKMKFVKDKLP
jgi:GNAT superfamily N-acetyltransferase